MGADSLYNRRAISRIRLQEGVMQALGEFFRARNIFIDGWHRTEQTDQSAIRLNRIPHFYFYSLYSGF